MSADAHASLPRPPQRRSGGPRSLEGRLRSAQNARRHGLTAAHPEAAAVADLLAELAGPNPEPNTDPGTAPDPTRAEGLQALAEAELHRRRVRAHLQHLGTELDAARARGRPEDPALWKRLRIAQRYRAEAEAAWRKALRRVIAEMA